ncbi:RICIN domain-containing protein, partial [Streptomyces sp. NRRL B-24572]|uniref:RICIN domain-containing protein n=1 Tax=Streptomyces sp. NRRL B-24572 TaxID=1962156 RepID=UPI00117C9401
SPVATGSFADTSDEKKISFGAATGRYLRLRALTEAGGRGQWTSAAEISATGAAVPLPADATVINAASGKCVDLPYSATTSGTAPTLYTCHGGTNQRWTLRSNGTLTGLSGVCLDGSTSPVTIATCDGSTGQQWQQGPQLSLRATGKCLAPSAGGTANGTKLVLATCSGTAQQQWRFSG